MHERQRRGRPEASPDHRLRHGRHPDAGAGFDHRQRGAAIYAGQPVGDLRPDHLGADQLRHRRRHHDRAGRLAGQPVRPQEPVHHLPGRLHHRLDAVRRGAVADPDGAVPAAAGRVRRRPGAAVAGDHAGHLPAGKTRPGDGDLGHGRDGRADPGPDPRRLPHRRLQLALGVLRQPAVRHPGDHRPDAVHAEGQRQFRPALRLDRLRRAGAGHRRLPDDARPRPGPGLVHLPRNHRRGGAGGRSAAICSWSTCSRRSGRSSRR